MSGDAGLQESGKGGGQTGPGGQVEVPTERRVPDSLCG